MISDVGAKKSASKQALALECSKCDYFCSDKLDLTQHYKSCHVDEDRSKPRFVTCANCTFTTDCERRVEFHQLFCTKMDHSKFECQECHLKSNFRGKMKSHVYNKHKGKLLIQVGADEEKSLEFSGTLKTGNDSADTEAPEVENRNKTEKVSTEVDSFRRCLRCDYKTTSIWCLVTHLMNFHKKNFINDHVDGAENSFSPKENLAISAAAQKIKKTKQKILLDCKFCEFEVDDAAAFVSHIV